MYLPVEAIAKYHAQSVGRYKFYILEILHIVLFFICLSFYLSIFFRTRKVYLTRKTVVFELSRDDNKPVIES